MAHPDEKPLGPPPEGEVSSDQGGDPGHIAPDRMDKFTWNPGDVDLLTREEVDAIMAGGESGGPDTTGASSGQ